MELRLYVIISQLFQVILPAKCIVNILELNRYQRFEDNKKKKMENLSLRLHVFHITANLKHINSRRGKDKNGSKMYKNEKFTCKACETIVFYC